MKTITALLASCFLWIDLATGQSLRHAIALPYIDLGAYSKEQTDPFSFTANQAALVQSHYPGFGVYTERRFLLAATSYYALAAVIPSRLGILIPLIIGDCIVKSIGAGMAIIGNFGNSGILYANLYAYDTAPARSLIDGNIPVMQIFTFPGVLVIVIFSIGAGAIILCRD